VGESTAIAHAIFIIVSVILAGLVAAVVISKLSTLQSVISQGIQQQTYAYAVKLTIVYGYYNDTGGDYVIYVKNTGIQVLSNISSIDVYLGPANGTLQYYPYSATGGTGHWNFTKVVGSGYSLAPGETVKIFVWTGESLGDIVKVKLVLPWGTTFEDTILS